MAKRFWAQLIEMDEEIAAASIPGVSDHESAADALGEEWAALPERCMELRREVAAEPPGVGR